MSSGDSAIERNLTTLDDLLARARRAGADAADAVMAEATAIAHGRRMGRIERLERSEDIDLGLRVLVGRRQACVATADTSREALDDLVERAVAMARSVPEDPYCGLADPDALAREWPALDSDDPAEPATETLVERARACEDAARAVEGVTNSEGADAAWSRARMALAATNGFRGGYTVSKHTVGCAVLAGEGTAMERDYAVHSAVYGEDLEDPAAVGRRAGERTVRRLNPRQPRTGGYPVVYHPRVANSLLRHLVGAISGPAVARGTSFLCESMGERILPAGTHVIDDPHRPRGLKSKPFDAEGLPTTRRALVDDGRLASWLLSLSSARQLGLDSTGHASRGTASPPSPSPTNLYLEPGTRSPEELMADIGEGFYVTELMGQGVNAVTGDYSRGAAGFWIENGKITHPVSELTLAGNLLSMFQQLTPANDLEFRFGVDAPTVRVDGMTLAGS
ncbi:microcin-processing peptidase 1. Unknown type peptidase. MEROPS family U62 [Limimonas halophila]|uniref:PmbA protein n=1 Tax=Limimonas halophila TaxID=1082479 RepID=A0A1G7TYE4_9PROT|nr:TldD/PmbA family protein [Limimonas halophila]SDG40385.1 microcin-processing peptidase 1. Unknown type peptidase. MEROPS family U62 [Limimonas halophila]